MLHHPTSTSAAKPFQKRPSRPASPDHAHAIHGNRAHSRSSRPGSRNILVKEGAPNPADQSSRFGAVTPTPLVSNMEDNANSLHDSPDGANAIKEGLGSVNRWSQSTSSSKSPPRYIGHLRDSSRRSNSSDYGSLQGPASTTRDLTPHQSPRTGNAPVNLNQRSEDYSPQRQRSLAPQSADPPALALPDFSKLPALPQSLASNDTTDSAQSHTDLVNAMVPSTNLFQDPWRERSGSRAEGSDRYAINSSTNRVPHPNHRGAMGSDVSGQNTSLFEPKEQPRGKRQRAPSQKAMLSKALQKANTAVLLDNAANFEGAMEAYNDACHLLQLVMLRSSGGNDEKLKLQEIRDTYMIRINELERLDFSFQQGDGKALPQRPLSEESFGDVFQSLDQEEEFFSGSMGPSQGDSQSRQVGIEEPRTLGPAQIPPRRQSLLPSAFDDELRYMSASPGSKKQHDRSRSQSSWQRPRNEHPDGARPAADLQSPLAISPRRLESPELPVMEANHSHDARYVKQPNSTMLNAGARDINNESTSWLDTIDESGASSPVSVQSQASSLYLRRRGSRRFSNGTEAEFDAALDAAVEAAYDEGLEPALDVYNDVSDDDVVLNARRNVELAKEKVREAEREAEVAMTRGREMRQGQEQTGFEYSNGPELDYLDEEAEEEERLLEEMTNGYVMDDFEFDLQSKSALPRQSDSSSFSGRTWGSSVASNMTPAAVPLSPLAEDDVLPPVGAKEEPSESSSVAGSTASPAEETSDISTLPQASSLAKPSSSVGPSVRARRLSGQHPKELKIETSTHIRTGSATSKPELLSMPSTSRLQSIQIEESQTGLAIPAANNATSASNLPSSFHSSRRNASISSFAEDNSTHPSLTRVITQEAGDSGISNIPSPTRPIGKVPSAPDNLGKSSSNMKAFRSRNVSVSTPDPSTDSPKTPSSSTFPTLEFQTLEFQKGVSTGSVPILPTPTGATFTPSGLPTGGMYLFDNNIHSPTSLGSPNPTAVNAPIALEPCPESFLLRPFWLMRCLYQTLAHPRGGYLSTKLFVPRDVWRVKNVKIKALEEKVSNCDLLTAALLKLAKVDTYDADAVLEEMQSLESVLDQVQTSLSKKLGSEVGVHGAMPLFKLAASSEDANSTSDTLPSKISSGPSKSYLSSWRKLRSKNSAHGPATPLPSSRETGKENLTISSLPMTSAPISQSAKRNVMQVQFNGPNANYMGALARLCDAAQVLDQIARQVEDPGLKHSSPTLVGLELSTRHAAEFFGFYVCRFALNDIGMMLDKFIKRGSEWVLI